MTRRVACGLALAMVVAGCGRGDGTEDVTVVEDLDILQAVEDEGSARISLDVEVEVPGSAFGDTGRFGGGGTTVMTGTAEGLFAYPGGDLEMAGTTTLGSPPPEDAIDEPLPPSAFTMDARRVDGRDYQRTRSEDGTSGPWVELPSAPAGEEGGADAAGALLGDPAALLDRVRDQARTLVEVGADDVRGAATTHYSAEVDRDEVEDGIGLWTDADDDVSIELWVDDQDRLRRLMAGGLTLELWDFGVPVEVAVPDDVRPIDEIDQDTPDLFAEVTGEWAEQSTGTTDGVDWTVFAAPAEIRGVPTTCRTLEPDVEGGVGGLGGLMGGEDAPLPVHGDALATCGSGGAFGAVLGAYFPDPAVQVLAPLGLSGPPLVGFVVAERHADGGVRLVFDDADPIDLEVDATGVAVWDPTGSPAVLAVELDGGAVSCPPSSLAGGGLDGDATSALTLGLDPCVAA